MERAIYKTYPRLIITSLTLLGAVFLALLAILIWHSFNDKTSITFYALFILFLSPSIVLFYYLFTIKGIELTKENLIVKNVFFPLRKEFPYGSVSRIYQDSKEVKALLGSSWNTTYIYTHLETIIEFTDRSKIVLNSIGKMEFQELESCFRKTKRGEGKIKTIKKNLILYLIDNVDGLFWAILLFIFNLGLGFSLLTTQ